ncbi:MAG: serine/threonine protein kinase, partial [Planctomycetaceae bacterium]|nr:serine/threonine protein kinase [Planctomycetaceae bacterium]
MIPEEAFRFGEAAIRRGWCGLAEIVDALAHVRVALTRGEVPPSFEDLLVARGVLTDERAAALMTELRLESTGEMVAGFRILARIGSGGVGTVYSARHVSMDRPVALKVIPVEEGEREADAERFLREARAVARLQHPHIVRGFDAGEHRGMRYIAMELLEGETALQVLRRIGPFPERRALLLVRAVASALDHAWTHGVVHRDVKPSNVFMTRDGRTVLFDFGLAKKVVDDPFSSAGVVAMVTPHYASPEQIRRLPDIDVRTDLYSLGCTWYHLLTGRPPFTGSSSAEIAARHLKDPFPEPDTGREPTDTLRTADAVIRRLCAKDREDRYPDARSLLADLDELSQAFERDGAGTTGRFARALLEKIVGRA